MNHLSACFQGFALGLGLFMCPGPKDVLILREAISGRSPLQLVGIGVASDVLLIGLGILGLSAALQHAPRLRLLAQGLGVMLLLIHAAMAARNALRGIYVAPPVAAGGSTHGSRGLRQLWLVSLCNPAAWLDTVLVIGTVGAALPSDVRPSFAAGAVSASLLWFSLWVTASRGARRWVGATRTWQILDVGIAVAMFAMAAWMIGDF